MSDEHTQGLLIVKNDYGLFQEDGKTAIGCAIWLKEVEGNAKSNARRLAACWNACDGVPTADIEQCRDTGLLPLISKMHQLSHQNDELLEALKRIESATMSMYATKAAMLDDIQEIAFAAIAKAEGSSA